MTRLFLFFLLFGTTVQAQTTYPAGVDHCIAHWDFTSETAITTLKDVSNSGHSGTMYNIGGGVDGYRNRTAEACYFNGSSSFAQVPNSVQLNPAQISIIALVRIKDFYAGNCQANNIIYKSYTYYSPGCWAMFISDQDYDHDCSQLTRSKEQMNFASSTTPIGSIPASDYISLNQWYLFVTTYDGNSLKRYQVPMDTVNYVTGITPISVTAINQPLGFNTSDVYIGATQNPSQYYWFNGDMDDVALFDKALSDSEVQKIYTYFRGTAPAPIPPIPTTGIAPMHLTADCIIWSHGNLQIKNPYPGQQINVSVYDMAGHCISKRSITEATSSFDLSSYAASILTVRLENNGTVITKRISNL